MLPETLFCLFALAKTFIAAAKECFSSVLHTSIPKEKMPVLSRLVFGTRSGNLASTFLESPDIESTVW